MIIFKINIGDSVALNAKRQPPVAGDVQAPSPLAAAGKLVGLPGWEGSQRFRTHHVLQEGEHRPEFANTIRRKPLGIAFKEQAFERLVPEALDPHPLTVAQRATVIKRPDNSAAPRTKVLEGHPSLFQCHPSWFRASSKCLSDQLRGSLIGRYRLVKGEPGAVVDSVAIFHGLSRAGDKNDQLSDWHALDR
jgi:hypothetical protein